MASAISFSSAAQNAANELWTGLGIEYRFSKSVDFDLGVQWRGSSMYPRTSEVLTDLGVKVDAVGKLDVLLTYRIKKVSDDFRWQHRFSPGLAYSFDIGKDLQVKLRSKVDLSYRPRFQGWNQSFRNKVEVRYELTRRIDPYVFLDLFYRNNYRVAEFNRMRLGGGIRLNLPKRIDAKIFYFRERELNAEAPTAANVIGVSLSRLYRR